MITIKTDVIRPTVNRDALSRHSARCADDIALSVTNNVKLAITRRGAIATGKTLKSITAERVLDSASRGQFRRAVTGRRAWLYIQLGRRPRGKMPVRRVGGRWEPFPEILEWFVAMNIPRERWFPIMRSIARRGIKPRDIRDRAVRDSRVQIAFITRATADRIAKDLFGTEPRPYNSVI